MKKVFWIIAVIVVIIIICVSCDSSGNSSYQSDTYQSDNYGGRYGYGSDYDDDVDYAADAFGTDSDSVNDLYGALGEAME